jgi:hypothetical protein
MVSPQQLPGLAALCGLVGVVAALLGGFGSAGSNTAVPVESRLLSAEDEQRAKWFKAELDKLSNIANDAIQVDRRVASPLAAADAGPAQAPEIVITNTVVASADPDAVAVLVTQAAPEATPAPAATAAPDKPAPFVVAALPDPSQALPEDSPPVPVATATTPDPPPGGDQAVNLIDILDECFVLEVCVDHYLWALYERTKKQDTNKVHERRKVKVWRKGKAVTVTKRYVRLVPADFTWKDPIAAEKAGMSIMDYVIGGMDRGFKLRLFHAFRAAEKEGLAPGITSGFRDDYRQSIASGQKAASNRSYHGGSLRGGYGHGAAVDVVSVKGATRAERWVSTDVFWKWIDANEKQFGVGRPYLDRDPPHVAPIDGEEYTSRRGTKTQTAQADVKKPTQVAVKKRTQVAVRNVAKNKKRKIVRAASAVRPAKQEAPAVRPTVAAAALNSN